MSACSVESCTIAKDGRCLEGKGTDCPHLLPDVAPGTTESPSGAATAARTEILPPPASANALLIRALKPCKSGPKKNLTLSDFLIATNNVWRAEQLKAITISDCPDFVPLVTSLSKTEEFGDVGSAISVMPKLCPGFDVQRNLLPIEVAQQLYLELMFLKALTAVER